MISPRDAVKVHLALHTPDKEFVTLEGKQVWIRDTNRPGKLFRNIYVGELNIVTQNMEKFSSGRKWVMDDPIHRRLTWVINKRENKYLMKIMQTGPQVRVLSLKGEDKIVLDIRVPWDEDAAIFQHLLEERERKQSQVGQPRSRPHHPASHRRSP